MSDTNYIKTLLDGKGDEYFVVAKEGHYRAHGGWRDTEDSIFLIAVPQRVWESGWNRIDPQNLTVRELDRIKSTIVECNIPLSNNFTPFQWGITVGSFYKAYPVRATREFIRKAWALKSNDLWDYKELSDKLTNKQEEQSEV